MADARLVVVEDDHIVALDIRQRLERMGYRIVGLAANAADAVRQVETTQPDLVLMDIRIDGPLDGIQAAALIAQRCAVPLVYLTAYSDEETLARAKVTEPFGFVLKPFNDRELLTTIEMAIYKHRMDLRLQANERWLATTLRSLGDAVMATDREGRIRLMNAVSEALTGWSGAEAAGRAVHDVFRVFDEKTKRSRDDWLDQVLARREVLHETNHLYLEARDGRRTPVDVSAAPIVEHHDVPVGMVLVFRDISERKRARQEIESLQRQLEFALQVTNTHIDILDTDYVVRYVDPGWQQTYGAPSGRKCYDYFMGQSGPCANCGTRRAFETQRLVTHEERLPLENDRPIQVTSVPYQDEHGAWLMIELNVDLTERKRMEAAREQERDLLRTLIDTLPLAIYVKDADSRFLIGNLEVAALMGAKSTQDLVGKTDFDFYPRALAERYRSDERDLLHGERALINKEEPCRDATGGERWMLTTKVPLRDRQERIIGLVGVSRDITERKKESAERARMETHMREVQKLESVGVLAGGIAHDFNNLLMGVHGNAELALMHLPPQSPVAGFLADIKDGCQRAASLTQQLLAYAGKGKVLVEPLSLSAMVRDMAHLLGTAISKKAELRLAIDDQAPWIEADAAQIQQIVMNLITNASEALGESPGTITLETGAVEIETQDAPSRYRALPLPAGRYAYVKVADTGCGMDAATCARMFEPFFSTKFMGRGLGLSAVLGIVRNHQGDLRVESVVGRGTSIQVLLPCPDTLRAAPAPGRRQASPPPPAEEPMHGTVLLADDDPTVLKLARRFLEIKGFKVLTARDGAECVAVFRAAATPIDAAVLDMTMPRMNGSEVCAALRQTAPDLPVVLTSGFSEEDATARFGDAPVAAFIQKPYAMDLLLRKLQMVIEGRRAPRPS